MKRVVTLLLVLSALAAPAAPRKKARKPKRETAAVAAARREKAENTQAEAVLKEPLKALRLACGAPKLRIEVDWGSFKGRLGDTFSRQTAVGLCETVADGFRQYCDERETKAPLAKQVSVLKCGFKKEAIRFQADKKDRSVSVFYSWETANLAEEMNSWLKSSF